MKVALRPGPRHLPTLMLLLALGATGARADELRNWFDDPFFPVTAEVPGCPEPAGPRVTEAERQGQSHRRAEKGTTCWLAGEDDCGRANAYAYDRDIAAEIRAAATPAEPFDHSSLWVTVQGRIVYVEGCVPQPDRAPALEAALRRLPHVQQAIAIVTTDPAADPPYRRFARRPSQGHER